MTPSSPSGLGGPLTFWLGTWEVRDTETNELAGRNVISELIPGNAVLEQWAGASGLSGVSLFYREGDQWFQVWATSVGRAKRKARVAVDLPAVRFEGIVDGMRDRTTLTPAPDGSVRQVIEVAPFGTDDWETGFDAIYVASL